jgi:hypothetical protein
MKSPTLSHEEPKFECFHKGSLDEFKILLSEAATLKSSLPPNTAGFK